MLPHCVLCRFWIPGNLEKFTLEFVVDARRLLTAEFGVVPLIHKKLQLLDLLGVRSFCGTFRNPALELL